MAPAGNPNVESVPRRSDSVEGTPLATLSEEQLILLKGMLAKDCEESVRDHCEIILENPNLVKYAEKGPEIDRIVAELLRKNVTVEEIELGHIDPASRRLLENIRLDTPENRLERHKKKQVAALSVILPSIREDIQRLVGGVTDNVPITTIVGHKSEKHLLSDMKDLPGQILVVPYVKPHAGKAKREGLMTRILRRGPVPIDRERLQRRERDTVKQHLKNTFEQGNPIVLYYSTSLEPALGHHEARFTDGGNLKWILSRLEKNSHRKLPTSKLIVIKENEKLSLPSWMEKLLAAPVRCLDSIQTEGVEPST